MKVEIRIRETAVKKGVMTAYQLQKRANLSPSNAARLYNNNIRQISIEPLDKLCKALDCAPGDLFVRPKSDSMVERGF